MTTAQTSPSSDASLEPTGQPTRKVDALLAHYGESHRNPRNEAIHYIAIPLIMFSLIGMMFSLHPVLAYVFMAASLVYYARLSMVFFAVMLVWSLASVAVLFAMGSALLPVSVVVFVGAWIMQFVGHKMEGKKPSFFEDIQYLWVGPLFVLSRLFGRLGWRW